VALVGVSGAAYAACADAGIPTQHGGAEALGDDETRRLEDDYEVLEVIGQGHFATVRRARNRKTGELVAVKTIAVRDVSIFRTHTPQL